MQLSFRAIATNLSISVGTVYNICKLFEATGEVDSTTPSREETRSLNGHEELIVIGLLFDNPSLYLSEICQKVIDIIGIEVSVSTACRIIHRHGLTRKKVQQVALQRSVEFRGKFLAEVQLYNKEQLVWIDETGCDRRDQVRKFGYALKGERPVYHRLLHRGQRISAIAALASSGLVALDLTKGTVDGEKFMDFIRGSLIPEMLPFDGQNAKSIAILDNCSIHHVELAVDLFREAGILVLFLPPYSPDLNPAEEMFSYIKYYLKDHDEILQIMDDPIPLLKSAFESVTHEKCLGWIMHSGYND